MLQFQQVTKTYGPQPLFEGVSFQINPKSRFGLIGRNGSGKSTILKLILGTVEPEAGQIVRMPSLRINYLSQEPHITPGNTLEAEVKSVFQEINALQAEETELLTTLGQGQGNPSEQLLNRLDTIRQTLNSLDAESVDARVSRTLKGLGFSQEDAQRRVEEFSGGWQMRINLAKILLEPTDLLLLDEPTNHLDLAACEWLESFLSGFSGAVLVVSHDRRFLDQVTTETLALDLGRLTLWPGNYTQYRRLLAEAQEQQVAAQERQQKELEKQSAFVERFRASATRSTQAKSREKQLAKVERIQVTQTDTRRMTARFEPAQTSGRQVLTIRSISKAFGELQLFQNVEADLQRHQRIFLLGPNGCGKTTLLKLILALESPDVGEIRPGHNVTLGYFSQNQLETLEPESTPFDTLQNVMPRAPQSEVRGALAQFLFGGEDVFKPIRVLSGGEKSKLALAVLMAQGPNTLLLDEPTNHMDIAAKEVMEEAFLAYPGTMLCISHDRYFIETLATDIWELYRGSLLAYAGGYAYYLETREARHAQVDERLAGTEGVKGSPPKPERHATEPNRPGMSPLQVRRDLEKQFNKVEKSIMAVEGEIDALNQKILVATEKQDYLTLQALSEALELKNTRLSQLNADWETLAQQLG